MDWKKRARFGAAALAIMVLAAAAFTGSSALAAKGGGAATGGGKHGGGGTTSSAKCWVNPNPATLYGDITINGSGFVPNASYGYVMDGSWVGFVVADATGSFSKISVAPLSGTNTVTFTGITSCTFTAQ